MKTILSLKSLFRIFAAFAVLVAALGFASAVGAESSCGATYTVQRGDYMTKIARLCGVSYSDLLKANPSITHPSLIYPGQVLNIPGGTIPVTGSGPATYTVKAGDTLYSIGQKYGVSVAELRVANPGVASAIEVGQKLNIPGRIRFAAGGTAAIVDGTLKANRSHVYLIGAGANQTLDVTLTAPTGASLEIRGADGKQVLSPNTNGLYRGVLPKTQDYALVVKNGGTEGDYGLSIAIPARIQFSPGGTSSSLSGTVPATVSQFYILRAAKGQTLNVKATPSTKLQLTVYGVDGTVLKSPMGEGASYSGKLPSSQDYILVLKTAGTAQAFNMTVSIPADSTIPTTGGTLSYTVKRGDTLFSIASRFGTTVNALLRANPDITNRNVIEVGEVIYLPGATLTLSNGETVYIAAGGDTMASIARDFGVTLSALIDANDQIADPNIIYTGERVTIP